MFVPAMQRYCTLCTPVYHAILHNRQLVYAGQLMSGHQPQGCICAPSQMSLECIYLWCTNGVCPPNIKELYLFFLCWRSNGKACVCPKTNRSPVVRKKMLINDTFGGPRAHLWTLLSICPDVRKTNLDQLYRFRTGPLQTSIRPYMFWKPMILSL